MLAYGYYPTGHSSYTRSAEWLLGEGFEEFKGCVVDKAEWAAQFLEDNIPDWFPFQYWISGYNAERIVEDFRQRVLDQGMLSDLGRKLGFADCLRDVFGIFSTYQCGFDNLISSIMTSQFQMNEWFCVTYDDDEYPEMLASFAEAYNAGSPVEYLWYPSVIPATPIDTADDAIALMEGRLDPGNGDGWEKEMFVRDIGYYLEEAERQGYAGQDAILRACETFVCEDTALYETVNKFINFIARYLIEYTEFTMGDGLPLSDSIEDRIGY